MGEVLRFGGWLKGKANEKPQFFANDGVFVVLSFFVCLCFWGGRNCAKVFVGCCSFFLGGGGYYTLIGPLWLPLGFRCSKLWRSLWTHFRLVGLLLLDPQRSD